ncbi:hypothetical protein TNCV_3273081 [Trichonephila clavipes]|nr:hypothetical protein TNCV_3273081 [Trichonephila clavipes]
MTKWVADHTSFCEVMFENVLNTKCNVWRSSILQKIMLERHGRACRYGQILFRNNDAYHCPVIEYVTGPPAPNSSKKYGPRIKAAENPHHTVTFGECSGTCKVECGSSDSQIRQL